MVDMDMRDDEMCEIPGIHPQRMERLKYNGDVSSGARLHERGCRPGDEVDGIKFAFADHVGIDGGDVRANRGKDRFATLHDGRV